MIRRAWFLVLPIALLGTGTAFAGTVFSDNFDSENGGTGQLNYTGFAKWNVTAGSVDLIGNGFFDLLPGNGLYVDLDGSTGQAGTLQTKTSFAPGNYTLSFDLAGSQRDVDASATITFGSLNQTISLPSNAPFTHESFNVTLTSADFITFASQTPGNVGELLDNVVLSTASAVPEPTSLALLGAGLLGLGMGRRRRRG